MGVVGWCALYRRVLTLQASGHSTGLVCTLHRSSKEAGAPRPYREVRLRLFDAELGLQSDVHMMTDVLS